MIPKIEFRYSKIYDSTYKRSDSIKNYFLKEKKKYPTEEEILSYTKKVKILWKKEANKLLKEISRLTGLKWKEKKVICYTLGAGIPFSDPLTIGIYKRSPEVFVNTLIHELIHQIQSQNSSICKRWYDYVNKKYSKCSGATISHLIVFSVHGRIIENFYGSSKLDQQIQGYNEWPEYKRAWDIVKKEGAENIIKDFRNKTKKRSPQTF